jgi:hypothetical protein
VTQKSWDLTPIASRGVSPIHILENGCKRLDASLDDVECCVWRGLHKPSTIGRLGVQRSKLAAFAMAHAMICSMTLYRVPLRM